MFTVDLVWAYIVVPVALVSLLILIKLRQEKTCKGIEPMSTQREKDEGAPPNADDANAEKSAKTKEHRTKVIAKTQSGSEPSAEKPKNCLHFLGYLYPRKDPDRTHIPSE